MFLPHISWQTPGIEITSDRELSEKRFLLYALPITLIYASRIDGINEFNAMGAVKRWATRENEWNNEYFTVKQTEYRCWLVTGTGRFTPIVSNLLVHCKLRDEEMQERFCCRPTMLPFLKLFLNNHLPKEITPTEWFQIYSGLPYTIKNIDSGCSFALF